MIEIQDLCVFVIQLHKPDNGLDHTISIHTGIMQ